MKVKLGIAPINWSNDDLPELGGDIPLEECLAQMRQAGFIGTEIGNKFPHDGKEIRALLGRYDLQLASAWHSTFFVRHSIDEELARLGKKLKVLCDAGARRINLCECTGSVHGDISQPLSARPRLSRKDWKHLCDGLSEAADMCERSGISVAYHHHMGTVIQDEDEVAELLSRTQEDVGLCFDSGHLRFAGADPIKCWSKFSHRVKHVHLKDVRLSVMPAQAGIQSNSEVSTLDPSLRWDDSSFLSAVKAGIFTVPGDGDIDFHTLIKMMIESDYRGWMIVEAEQDPAKANPLKYARKAKVHLDAIFNSAKEADYAQLR